MKGVSVILVLGNSLNAQAANGDDINSVIRSSWQVQSEASTLGFVPAGFSILQANRASLTKAAPAVFGLNLAKAKFAKLSGPKFASLAVAAPSANTSIANGTSVVLDSPSANNSGILTDGDVSTTEDIIIDGGSLLIGSSEQLDDKASISMSSGNLTFTGSGNVENFDKLTITGGTFSTGANQIILHGATASWLGGTNTITTGGMVSDKHWVIEGGTNTVEDDAILRVSASTISPFGLFFQGTGTPIIMLTSGDSPAELLLRQNVTVVNTITGTAEIQTVGAGSLAGIINLDGGNRTFTVGNSTAAVDFAISATLAGGSITKAGAGVMQLTGSNTYAGTTTVNAGNLFLKNEAASNVTILGDGNVATTQDIFIQNGGLRIDADEQIANTASIHLAAPVGLGFSIFGFEPAGGLTETVHTFTNAGGTFSTGANTLISKMVLSGGITQIQEDGVIRGTSWNISGGTNTVLSGGLAWVTTGVGGGLVFSGTGSPTIQLASDAVTQGDLNLNQDVLVEGTLTGTAGILSTGSDIKPGTVNLRAGNRKFTVNNGAAAVDLSVSARLSNGGITKEGLGTMQISGDNTYSGTTIINAGTLLLGASNTLPNSSNVTLAAGATLNTGGFDDSTGTLTVSGAAIIDFGTASGSELSFNDVGVYTGPLSVWNYNGAVWTEGADKLIFQLNSGGVDLSGVTFFSDAGLTQIGVGAGFIGTELVPIPESRGVISALLLFGFLGTRERGFLRRSRV